MSSLVVPETQNFIQGVNNHVKEHKTRYSASDCTPEPEKQHRSPKGSNTALM